MDTIRSIMPYFSFVLSCIALGISIASLQSVEEDLKILTELINLVEKEDPDGVDKFGGERR